MFKKLHSNRDPNTTLITSIKAEFGDYFYKAEKVFTAFLNKYPKVVFKSMLFAIALSLVLSFTVLRSKEPKGDTIASLVSKTSPQKQLTVGLDDILLKGQLLKETISLNKEIQSLLAKKKLERQDSVLLEKALDRLQYLSKSLN